MKKLNFKDYPEKTFIKIAGINYAYDFFKMLGNAMPVNCPFVIVERKNNTVTIEKYKLDEDMELLKDAKRLLKKHQQKSKTKKSNEKKARELVDLFHRWKEEDLEELPLHTAKNIVRQIQFAESIY